MAESIETKEAEKPCAEPKYQVTLNGFTFIITPKQIMAVVAGIIAAAFGESVGVINIVP